MLDARYNLGVVYTENEMHREAIHEFKQVLMSRLEDIETLVSLGLAYKNGGLVNKAINRFKDVLVDHPDNISALNNLGLIHLQKGNMIKQLHCLGKQDR